MSHVPQSESVGRRAVLVELCRGLLAEREELEQGGLGWSRDVGCAGESDAVRDGTGDCRWPARLSTEHRERRSGSGQVLGNLQTADSHLHRDVS
eukprot:3870851-Rhodomonas_salina.1